MNDLEIKRLDFDKNQSDRNMRLHCLELSISHSSEASDIKTVLNNADKMFQFIKNGTKITESLSDINLSERV